jgi:hypothetical protein
MQRQLYEKLSADDLASLPADMREEFVRQNSGAKREQRRIASALERLPPTHKRDMTPTLCLVLAHNNAVGIVFVEEEYEEEVQLEDGVEKVKVEDGVDDNGKAKFKVEQIKKYRTELQTKTRTKVEERPLVRKERVSMPRWCAQIMADNDHVVIL